MPIDRDAALRAEPTSRALTWTADDVLLYHLSLGAGAYRTDPDELQWIYERQLQVLPTFAVVAGRRSAGPTAASPAGGGGALRMPGIDVDLRRVLHAGQSLVLHAPIPTAGTAVATSRIADVWDKGKAAVIVTEETVRDESGSPLWTSSAQIWARGEGGFDGPPGDEPGRPAPEGQPDLVIDAPTSVQTAALYRLNGDRNPLHIDPDFARLAGFDRPILHGLAAYGIAAKAVVDAVLDTDPTAVAEYRARFAGTVRPGETLRIRLWREAATVAMTVHALERDEAAVLTHARIHLRAGPGSG